MFLILGASGHIGDALVKELLEKNQDVLAVTHNARNVDRFARQGAQAVVVDLHDVSGVRSVFLSCK